MNFVAEIRKEFQCDVLVVGGGVAGFAAALRAAREGAHVILAEENGYLGGTATAGLVAPFMTCYDAAGERQIIRGIFDELVSELVRVGGAVSPADCRKCDSFSGYKLRGHLGTTPIDKEQIKLVMERMCLSAGVELKYHYMFVGAEACDRRITACTFATKGGFYRISAKAVLDCTGDASVCHAAGGACVFSDDEGNLQPVSTFFTIDNVDKEALDAAVYAAPDERGRAFMELIEAARAEEGFPCGTVKVRLYEQPNGIWSVNMCQIDRPFDVNDPDEITKAEIEGREQAHAIFAFLKARVPGLKNARLLATSERVGIRESRRIVGEYTLTHGDLLESRQFDDTVVVLANSVDVHTSGAVKYTAFNNPLPYTIPYRALVHRDFDNVWSAGKTLSADRMALGAVRVMPPAMAMGEACGLAAAIAVAKDLKAKDVPTDVLRAGLDIG